MYDEVDIFASDKIKEFMKKRLYVYVGMILLTFACNNINVNLRYEKYEKNEKSFFSGPFHTISFLSTFSNNAIKYKNPRLAINSGVISKNGWTLSLSATSSIMRTVLLLKYVYRFAISSSFLSII